MSKIGATTLLTMLLASSSHVQGFSTATTSQSAYCYTNPVFPTNAQVTVTSSDLNTAPFATTIVSTLTATFGTAIITDPASAIYSRTATVTAQGPLIAVTQYAATSTTLAVVTSTVTAQNQCQSCYATTSAVQLLAASVSGSVTAPKKRDVENLEKRAITGTAVVQCTYINVITAYTASGTPQVYHSTPIVSSGVTTATVTGSAVTTTVLGGTTISTATTTVLSTVTPCCQGIGIYSGSTISSSPVITTPPSSSSSSAPTAGPLTTSISGLPYACSPIYPAVTTQLFGVKYVCNAN
ncbi:hypothetical protein K461DRAFT_265746 [Myriangium duriaei CBS 260.36]|uniref:Ig-like domain-containing protein n=1 Tax=Myriangium duriaei CBS 260.36 TaxID=1168546 RepID=A0A9P4JC90_9PEZI|nr:hypothetical protein K461DRAFT_265746 [Myriangium duriaei CBS 260.36]